MEIKPCPFCGSKDIETYGNYYLACNECSATAGAGDTENAAIKAWNTRAAKKGDK